MKHLGVAVASAVLLTAFACSSQRLTNVAPADVLILNGKIYPADDSPVHFLAGGTGLGQADLPGLMTLSEIQDRIRAFAAAHPDQASVRGRGWLDAPFPGGMPTRGQLDLLVPDRPAYMTTRRTLNRLLLDSSGPRA